ncbi:MAG TPA: universal stress protein [Gemmatimonadaceae bacterium]|nr:universal stress protein [Gemmatimonadaceae bacterium]
MFRNIMVPVDGSSFSREAVIQGLRLASLYGATLRLVKVATTPAFSTGPEGVALESRVSDDQHAAELANLYSIAAECRAHSTINVTASLERGPVVDALCGYARRNAVDLIVMRSQARRGIARIWFGSVADGLIRESGLPVLVVRPPSIGTGLEKGFTYRKILVPLDGSNLAEQALPRAISLARFEGASIVLVFVVPPNREAGNGTLISAIGPASANDVAAAQYYLDSIVTQFGTGLKLDTRVVIAADIPAAILRVADTEEVDLITMATRGQGMMARTIGGSVSDRVMRESVSSTLVVHPISRPAVQSQPHPMMTRQTAIA